MFIDNAIQNKTRMAIYISTKDNKFYQTDGKNNFMSSVKGIYGI